MDSLLTLSVMRGARQVASLADLRRLNGARGETIVLVGSLVAGDGGGGLYRWDTTSTTGDDGNQIVVPVIDQQLSSLREEGSVPGWIIGYVRGKPIVHKFECRRLDHSVVLDRVVQVRARIVIAQSQ